MFSKRAVVVSTAAGAGTNKATKDIATALFYWGADITSYGKTFQAINWEQVSNKKTRFIFNIMRMMKSGAWDPRQWKRNTGTIMAGFGTNVRGGRGDNRRIPTNL